MPTIPPLLWQQSGSDIYYNMGNVGVGTSTPLFPLDVFGSVRISNNLYVGGGVVISDKVNAISEVKSRVLIADSIMMDSTKAVYGLAKFNGDVKLQSKLNVNGDALLNGNATVNGNFKTMGNLTFAGNQVISYQAASVPYPEVLAWGMDGNVYFLENRLRFAYFFSMNSNPVYQEKNGITNFSFYKFGSNNIALFYNINL